MGVVDLVTYVVNILDMVHIHQKKSVTTDF
jgi:hypothetical protein